MCLKSIKVYNRHYYDIIIILLHRKRENAICITKNIEMCKLCTLQKKKKKKNKFGFTANLFNIMYVVQCMLPNNIMVSAFTNTGKMINNLHNKWRVVKANYDYYTRILLYICLTAFVHIAFVCNFCNFP